MIEFNQIAYLVVFAGVAGVIAKLLKQPLLIGYLFAGIIIAAFDVVSEVHALESLAQIGVTLLLFLLGLEMNLKELPSIGKVAVVTGIGQIVFTSALGFLLSMLLGFDNISSIYIAVSLTFSSTIIMVKLLSEKNDLSSLYGKISVGFLLVQDFVAVVILMFLSSLGSGQIGGSAYAIIAGKALALFAVTWVLSKRALPYIFERMLASSTELLFVGSIAWALGVASFVAGPMGFTLEIGGFLAGIALSNLPEHLQIATRAKPLRDFFLVIFFMLLGTQLIIGEGVWSLLPKATIFSIFVLVGNPVIVLVLMGLLGYKKRTSFMAGLTVAQISEFSFILMNMGEGVGHVSSSDVSLVVIVGVITMTLSTYLILGADKVFSVIHPYLSVFEKKKTKEAAFVSPVNYSNHLVLVGSDRTGTTLAKYFKNKSLDFVVVDFNPHVFTRLTVDGIPVVFGDINDPDVAEASKLQDASMVISTINSLSGNEILLERLRKMDTDVISLFTASRVSDAIKLYEKGATYVTVPDILAGEHIRYLLSSKKLKSKKKFKRFGERHFNRLMYKN